jgi:pectate lyase-like protein/putative Ig domain-containing protein
MATVRTSLALMLVASLGAALGGCHDDSSSSGDTAAPSGVPRAGSSNTLAIAGTPASSVAAGTAYNFQPQVTSAARALSFTISNKPAWSSFNVTTGALAGTPSAADAGTYPMIEISVNDGVAGIALSAFSITVTRVGTPVVQIPAAPVAPATPATTHSTKTLLSVPSSIKSGGHQNDPLVYAGYLDVTLYGADPTGQADSTAAFQKAMIDASGDSTSSVGSSMLVYVPPGTYMISNTITGYQSCSNGSPSSNQSYGSIQKYGAVSAPSLVGPGSGPRPTIVLKDNTFTDPSNPQPMIHLVNSPNVGAGGCGGQYAGSAAVGAFDILFNAVVRDINVTTGNNPGAIGVQFYSAQKSYMQNVLVNATNGFIGIQGAPATDMWTNVEVNGGQYGIWIDQTAGVSAIAGLTLENQSVAGVYFDAVGDLAISGFNIQETNSAATAIVASERIPQGSTLSLVDGIISTSSASKAALSNTGGDSLYLNDVYIQASKTLVANAGSTAIAASGAMQLISEYAHSDRGANASGSSNPGYAVGSSILVNDGGQSAADFGPTYGAVNVAPPTDLVTRHVPGPMPWAFDANAFWATDYGADPTGFTDSTTPIQSAINAAHANGSDEVFLPRGDYSISGTLKLYPNTKFFGLPGAYSQLLGYGWVTNHTLQPYLQVGDAINDAAATIAGQAIVSDIAILLPSNSTSYAAYAKLLPNNGANYDPTDQTYLYAIDWQTGQGSVANQVSINYQGSGNLTQYSPAAAGSILITPATRNIVQIDHSGGGRWYGLQVAGGGFNSPSGYTFYATGTSAPLTIYGSNIEHATGAAFYGFSNASNVRVLGSKTESGSATYWFAVDHSNNIMLSGLTTHQNSTVIVSNSTNINLNTLDYFALDQSEQNDNFITDDKESFNFVDTYALYKLNTPGSQGFNNSVFPN